MALRALISSSSDFSSPMDLDPVAGSFRSEFSVARPDVHRSSALVQRVRLHSHYARPHTQTSLEAELGLTACISTITIHSHHSCSIASTLTRRPFSSSSTAVVNLSLPFPF